MRRARVGRGNAAEGAWCTAANKHLNKRTSLPGAWPLRERRSQVGTRRTSGLDKILEHPFGVLDLLNK